MTICSRSTRRTTLYLPGQYLTVRLYIPGIERPVVRSYSLSDAAGTDHYRLTIKQIPRRAEDPGAAFGLVSTYFHDLLAVGDQIEAKAPAGTFTVDVFHRRTVTHWWSGYSLT